MQSFNKEYLDAFTNTSWFKNHILECMPHKQDENEHEYQLRTKFETEQSVYIDLDDKEINRLFCNYNVFQLVWILFGHWYGLSKKRINFYARKGWDYDAMQNIIRLFIIFHVPDDEIYETFGQRFSYQKYQDLWVKYDESWHEYVKQHPHYPCNQ